MVVIVIVVIVMVVIVMVVGVVVVVAVVVVIVMNKPCCHCPDFRHQRNLKTSTCWVVVKVE